MTVKAGWKTSEFWITMGAAIYGALLTTGVLPADSQVVQIVSLIATAAVAIGWTAFRVFIKAKSGN